MHRTLAGQRNGKDSKEHKKVHKMILASDQEIYPGNQGVMGCVWGVKMGTCGIFISSVYNGSETLTPEREAGRAKVGR